MLILASKSPRRSEILKMSGISFKVVVKDVEENVIEDNPALYALKTAKKIKTIPLQCITGMFKEYWEDLEVI